MQAVEEFSPSFYQYVSTETLSSLDGEGGDAKMPGQWSSKKTLAGLLFRTMGKINHTYESSDSLATMSSSNSLASQQFNSSPNLFSVMEAVADKLTIQQTNSAGNLVSYGDEHAAATTFLDKFFSALQIFLNPQEGGAQEEGSHFPKFC